MDSSSDGIEVSYNAGNKIRLVKESENHCEGKNAKFRLQLLHIPSLEQSTL